MWRTSFRDGIDERPPLRILCIDSLGRYGLAAVMTAPHRRDIE